MQAPLPSRQSSSCSSQGGLNDSFHSACDHFSPPGSFSEGGVAPELHAIKFVMLRGEMGERRLRELQREIVNLWRCTHRNVAAIKGIMVIQHRRQSHLPGNVQSAPEAYLAIATEFCSGGELSVALTRGGKDETWFMERFAQLLSAVECLHSRYQMCHRDLKLENIMLSGPSEEVRVVDFGTSRSMCAQSEETSDPKSLVGTYAYMSPEVLGGQGNVPYKGDKADIWSMGVLLYLMRYRDLPFGGVAHCRGDALAAHVSGNPFQVSDRVRRGVFLGPRPNPAAHPLDDLIMRMLERNPPKRIKVDDIWRHPAMTGYTRWRGNHERAAQAGVQQDPQTAELVFQAASNHVQALAMHRQQQQRAYGVDYLGTILDESFGEEFL